MNKTVLLVEDDQRIRQIILDYFENDGFTVLEADTGSRAIEMIKTRQIDLLILDIMLPQVDGWTVCRTTRAMSNVPIIMLTARAQEEDRLMGFELGADDYVTKPFSPRELVARAKALLKRSAPAKTGSPELWQIGPVKIDRLSHQVFLDEELIYLSPKEYELLVYLMNNAGLVLSREQLLHGVWGYSHYGNLRTVDTHINRLRDKLEAQADLVQTVRGFGYKFAAGVKNEKH